MQSKDILRMHSLPASSFDEHRAPHVAVGARKLRSSRASLRCPHHFTGLALNLFSNPTNVYYSLKNYSNLFGFWFCFLADYKEHYFKSSRVLFYIKTSL